MTAKQRFEAPFTAEPQEWEKEPFVAVAKFGFSLEYKSVVRKVYDYRTAHIDSQIEPTGIHIYFVAGDEIECVFGRTEYADKSFWCVRFSKNGFDFQLSAPDFFKLFDA